MDTDTVQTKLSKMAAESKRLCSETCVLVLSVIQVLGAVGFIVTSIWSLAALVPSKVDEIMEMSNSTTIICVLFARDTDKCKEEMLNRTTEMKITMTVVSSFIIIMSLLYLVFNLYLIYGIHKKRPEVLRRYLFFGVLTCIIMSPLSILDMFYLFHVSNGTVLAVAACIVLYLLFLAAVLRIYNKMLAYEHFINCGVCHKCLEESDHITDDRNILVEHSTVHPVQLFP